MLWQCIPPAAQQDVFLAQQVAVITTAVAVALAIPATIVGAHTVTFAEVVNVLVLPLVVATV
jgi:hypothetical protein